MQLNPTASSVLPMCRYTQAEIRFNLLAVCKDNRASMEAEIATLTERAAELASAAAVRVFRRLVAVVVVVDAPCNC